jgi:hypothetical protein
VQPGSEHPASGWTYDERTDMWLAPDRRTAIQGTIVRRMAEDLLRERVGGWYRASPQQQAEAIRDVLLGDWREQLGRESA